MSFNYLRARPLDENSHEDWIIISDMNRLEFYLDELQLVYDGEYNRVYGNSRVKTRLNEKGILEIRRVRSGDRCHVLSPYGIQLFQCIRRKT